MEMDSLVKEWRELILKSSMDEAKKFYWKNIYPLVEKRFIGHVNEKIKEKSLPQYDWLIIPAGLEGYATY